MSDNKQPKKKYVLAMSKAHYKGVTLYETRLGVGFFLGVEFYVRLKLEEATALIDEWIDQRKN